MPCVPWAMPVVDPWIAYVKFDQWQALSTCKTRGQAEKLALALILYGANGKIDDSIPKSIQPQYLCSLEHLDHVRTGARNKWNGGNGQVSDKCVTSDKCATSEAPVSDQCATSEAPVSDKSTTSEGQTSHLPAETLESLDKHCDYDYDFDYGFDCGSDEELGMSIDYRPLENSNANLTIATQSPMDMLDASQQMKVRNKADTLSRKGYDYEEMEQTLAATMVHDGEDHMMQQVGRLMNAAQQGQVVDVSTGEISPTYTHDEPQLYPEDLKF